MTGTRNFTRRGKVGSFEIDSLEWWKRSGIWIVAILAAASYLMFQPEIHRRHSGAKRAKLQETISNARQIGLALNGFRERFGSYPNEETARKLATGTKTGFKAGNPSSNDLFRQIFTAGIELEESVFFAGIPVVRRADHQIQGNKALEKGECGFAYLSGATKNCNPRRPVAITPLIPGTRLFDPKPFDAKAVVLHADMSVSVAHIRRTSNDVLLDRRDLMDPAHPVWEGNPPVIAWPE